MFRSSEQVQKSRRTARDEQALPRALSEVGTLAWVVVVVLRTGDAGADQVPANVCWKLVSVVSRLHDVRESQLRRRWGAVAARARASDVFVAATVWTSVRRINILNRHPPPRRPRRLPPPLTLMALTALLSAPGRVLLLILLLLRLRLRLQG